MSPFASRRRKPPVFSTGGFDKLSYWVQQEEAALVALGVARHQAAQARVMLERRIHGV